MADARRFVRQMLLAEIGEAGQERIARAVAHVGAKAGEARSLAHEVAVAYASAAGFGAMDEGPIDVLALAPAALVKEPAAREVLAGARAALAAVRAAAGIPPRTEKA
jgi:hypothetical protein